MFADDTLADLAAFVGIFGTAKGVLVAVFSGIWIAPFVLHLLGRGKQPALL